MQFSLRAMFLLTTIFALAVWFALTVPVFALVAGLFLIPCLFGLTIACFAALVALTLEKLSKYARDYNKRNKRSDAAFRDNQP